jgi:hypothetical protein
MPNPVAQNPLGAYNQNGIGLGPDIVEAVNNTTSTMKVGDVVVIQGGITSTTAVYTPNVTTSTTANDTLVIGVVAEKYGSSPDLIGTLGSSGNTYPAGGIVPVVIDGVARVRIGGNTVTAGAPLVQSGTASIAQANTLTTASTLAGSIIGFALEANTNSDSNSTIRAYIHKT